MADDDLIDDEEIAEGDLDEDLDADALVEDDEIDPLAEDDDVVVDDDAEAVVADDEAEDEEEVARTKGAKREDDEDDDEEIDPDDVEADLDAILKVRIAAAEDDDEEDEEVAPEPRPTGDVAEGVQPKKANEFTCTGCFLLVNPGQFGPPEHMTCPVGEAVCPAIERLRGTPVK